MLIDTAPCLPFYEQFRIHASASWHYTTLLVTACFRCLLSQDPEAVFKGMVFIFPMFCICFTCRIEVSGGNLFCNSKVQIEFSFFAGVVSSPSHDFISALALLLCHSAVCNLGIQNRFYYCKTCFSLLILLATFVSYWLLLFCANYPSLYFLKNYAQEHLFNKIV